MAEFADAGGAGTAGSRSISSSLLERLRSQDSEAWRRLLILYSPLVYSWCRRSEIHADDAADVLQEVFRAAAAGISSFRRDRPGDTFRGWLRTIARNKIRDHFRNQAVQPDAQGGTEAHERFLQVADEVSESLTGTSPLAGLCQRGLDAIRAEFEPRTWEAFWLIVVEGRDGAEVAEELGLSRGAVRQAKYKVLRRLRQEMGDAE